MLYFYKNPSDQLAIEIEDALNEMSAAHRIIPTAEESFLAENEKEIRGQEAVKHFLENYFKLVTMPHSISADSCRIDPETGETC
ncbi:MAG: hypothetical protein NXI20_09495 [bacterium]|nr:hypothetical protein [bacterium]